MSDFYLIGTLPPLDGLVVQFLVALVITHPEAETLPRLIVHLRLETGGWRLFSDGPHLHVRFDVEPPQEWDAPEEGLGARLQDLGQKLDLQGGVLQGWSYGVHHEAPSLTLSFQDGRHLTFSGEGNGFTSYTLTTWHVNPSAS